MLATESAAWQETNVKPFSAILLPALVVLSAAPGIAAPTGAPQELRYLVFIRPDPARTSMPLDQRQRIMDAHMANINKMAADGLLDAAGPMDDNPVTVSGIFVLNAGSLAEARSIAERDPTVTGKRNTVDVHPWLCPAGIGTGYFKWKKENPDAKDVMNSHAFCVLRRGPASPSGALPYDESGFIESLRLAGSLAAAGPINDDPELVGVLIFKAASVAEARKSLDGDPSVKSGRITVEYHVWWTADRILPW